MAMIDTKPAVGRLSAQAKAITGGLGAALLQLQVYLGQGGWDAVAAIKPGEWIGVVLYALTFYGVVYQVPNVQTLGTRIG